MNTIQNRSCYLQSFNEHSTILGRKTYVHNEKNSNASNGKNTYLEVSLKQTKTCVKTQKEETKDLKTNKGVGQDISATLFNSALVNAARKINTRYFTNKMKPYNKIYGGSSSPKKRKDILVKIILNQRQQEKKKNWI